MIRSVVTLSALGLALAGCTTGEATNQAPRPAPVVAPVAPAPVQQAPAVEKNSQPQQAPAFTGYTCEPNANARFDNPANPHELTNKSCGYTDEQGQERSHNPWIDDQLDQARQNEQALRDGEQWLRQQQPQVQQMVDDAHAQQRRNLEQINQQLPANVPQVPTVLPGDAGYEQQMDTYRQQVNEYMCAEGNAYTIPSNQRSC